MSIHVQTRNFTDGSVQAIFVDDQGEEIASMAVKLDGTRMTEPEASSYTIETRLRLDHEDKVFVGRDKEHAWVRAA